MAQSPFQQAAEQHLRLRQQQQKPYQQNSVNWEAEVQLQAHIQQALLAVQDLEQQRLNQLKTTMSGKNLY